METNILIVDDEAAIADLVEVYLKNEGYTVHKFGRAGDALACVASTPLDLAILDVMLPDMDGFTLCQKIREEHLFPILMLTARVEDMDKIMGLTWGRTTTSPSPSILWSWWPGSRPSSGGTPGTTRAASRGERCRSTTSGGSRSPGPPTSACCSARSSP